MSTPREVRAPFTAVDNSVYIMSTWGFTVLVIAVTSLSVSAFSGLAVMIGFYAACITFVLLWVCFPVSFLVGHWMRHVPGVLVHLAVFWAVGTAASAALLWFSLRAISGSHGPTPEQVLLAAVICGLCTAAGRLCAVGARRRRGNRPTPGKTRP